MRNEFIYIDGKQIQKNVAKSSQELLQALDKINEMVTNALQSEGGKIDLTTIARISTQAITNATK